MILAYLALSSHVIQSPDFKKWGLETIEIMQRDLMIPKTGLFSEEAHPGKKPKEPAYTWGVGVLLQALNSAATADSRYRSVLIDAIQGTRSYWNEKGPVAGYDVHPMPKPMDRYYDDNAWMVIALVESSKLLKSPKILEYAKQTYQFVISGRDARLGGGIYWRESDKATKNTCSNGPSAAAALALYDETQEKTYLSDAIDIYAWTKKYLRDPSDGLYWDSIDLNGKIGRAKWSYNTGLMLRTAADLYRLTKNEGYADDAREMQKSSLTKWVSADGSLKDDGKFVHLLLENWIRAFVEVPGAMDPRPAINVGLTWLHDHSRDSLGHYGNRWDKPAASQPYSPFKLIDQAAAARAFLQVSTV